MDVEKITKIGFFHFGKDYDKPMETLRRALNKWPRQTVSGALLVLPEGFNICRLYSDTNGTCTPVADVVSLLKVLTKEYDISILACLILEISGKKRNCSVLIDGDDEFPICEKMVDDGSQNYVPSTEDYDRANPKPYKDVLIGCLICADSEPPKPINYADPRPDIERCQSFRKAMKATEYAPEIVCIPSHPTTNSTQALPICWQDYNAIVYASSSSGIDRGSCIGFNGKELLNMQGEVSGIRFADLLTKSALCCGRLSDDGVCCTSNVNT